MLKSLRWTPIVPVLSHLLDSVFHAFSAVPLVCLQVLQEYHGLLDRHQLMLEACEVNSVSEEDYIDLGKAGLGSCLLAGLPNWLIAYSARLVCFCSELTMDYHYIISVHFLNYLLLLKVRFINFERTKLPDEILKHNLEEKKKYFSDICLEVEKNESEIQVRMLSAGVLYLVYIPFSICMCVGFFSLYNLS